MVVYKKLMLIGAANMNYANLILPDYPGFNYTGQYGLSVSSLESTIKLELNSINVSDVIFIAIVAMSHYVKGSALPYTSALNEIPDKARDGCVYLNPDAVPTNGRYYKISHPPSEYGTHYGLHSISQPLYLRGTYMMIRYSRTNILHLRDYLRPHFFGNPDTTHMSLASMNKMVLSQPLVYYSPSILNTKRSLCLFLVNYTDTVPLSEQTYILNQYGDFDINYLYFTTNISRITMTNAELKCRTILVITVIDRITEYIPYDEIHGSDTYTNYLIAYKSCIAYFNNISKIDYTKLNYMNITSNYMQLGTQFYGIRDISYIGNTYAMSKISAVNKELSKNINMGTVYKSKIDMVIYNLQETLIMVDDNC